jgi:hypothetical protein
VTKVEQDHPTDEATARRLRSGHRRQRRDVPVQRRAGDLVVGHLGHPGAKLTLQTDGNLVVRSTAGKAPWNSGTPGTGASNRLVISATGRLTLDHAVDRARPLTMPREEPGDGTS